MTNTYCINHSFSSMPDAAQVITAKEWRTFLQHHDRHIFCNGTLRELYMKSLGAGMVEIKSRPLKS